MASIVGLSKISMPRLDGLDTASARELRNYLYQMQEQLEYILSNREMKTIRLKPEIDHGLEEE